MGYQSIARLPPALSFFIPIYTPEWRETLGVTCLAQEQRSQCPRPGLECGPLYPEMTALNHGAIASPKTFQRYPRLAIIIIIHIELFNSFLIG